jgi:hypothetical protein
LAGKQHRIQGGFIATSQGLNIDPNQIKALVDRAWRGQGAMKYLSYYKYLEFNVNRVVRLGLGRGRSKRVLGMGCGAGFFLFALSLCRHEGIGIAREENAVGFNEGEGQKSSMRSVAYIRLIVFIIPLNLITQFRQILGNSI